MVIGDPLTKKIDSKETKRLKKASKGKYVAEYLEEGVAGTPEYIRVRLPNIKGGEMFGIADQLLGGGRIKVMCADGKYRMGRIPGKYKKRLWVRTGDLVVIKPWEFQDEKAEIVWRYTSTEAKYLAKKNILPEMFVELIT